jgi:uncharacterized protein YggE
MLTTLLLCSLAPLVVAQTQERSITVQGTSTVHMEPDMATVRFGIVTRAQDPEAARTENATASKNAMNAVRDLGIQDRKIRLEQLRLNPAREFNPDTRRYEDAGFEVTRILVVNVLDLDALPTLIAHVIQQGANRLDGVSYEL